MAGIEDIKRQIEHLVAIHKRDLINAAESLESDLWKLVDLAMAVQVSIQNRSGG